MSSEHDVTAELQVVLIQIYTIRDISSLVLLLKQPDSNSGATKYAEITHFQKKLFWYNQITM